MKSFSCNIKCFFLILFLVVFSKSYCQDSPITIKSKKSISTLKPGKHYTLIFEATNTSSENQKINLTYNLPSSFKAIFAPKTKTIPANSKKNLIFSFAVHSLCKSNNYTLELNASINGKLISSSKMNVKVEKIYNLSIESIKSPDYLRFEKEFTSQYLITNKGNSSEKITLESPRSISISTNQITLKPDSSAVVSTIQAVPFSPYNQTIVLNVLKAKIENSELVFSQRTSVPVYPNSKKKPDLYQRYPISIATEYNYLKGLDTLSAFKISVNGAGYLDREREHYLDFSYSGPNQPKLNRFGEYDQYNILYRYKNATFYGGTISYSLTNLTENSRYGIGGILSYKFPKAEVKVFYLEPRFNNNISSSFGGDVNWEISEKQSLKFGFIDRTIIENDEPLKSQLFSISSALVINNLKINGELAFENNEFSNGFAYSLESFYNTPKLGLGASYQFSDENFKGYLRNSKQLITYANYRFSKKLSSSIGANYTSINPEQDEINYNSSPIVLNYYSNLNYRINRKNNFKLGASYRKKEDRFEPKKFHFEEQLINFSYAFQKINRLNVRFLNRFGSSKNLLIENAKPQTAFYSSLEYSMNIIKNLNFGVFGNYESTNRNTLNSEIQNSIYYGGNLEFLLNNSLNLSLFYRSDYALDELSEDTQSFIEARLGYNIKNHRFLLSASQASLPSQTSNLEKELLVKASYNFIINAPISKDKTKGVIKGKISSTENDNLEGILVSLKNNASITNEKGEFIFYNLVPGEYTITIPQSSLPKNKIILENTPYIAEALPNKETFVEFNLGKTGNLKGTVKLRKNTALRSDKFEKSLPRVIIKIYNKNQKFLTQTNSKGEFSFLKLVPGEWTVELLVKSLLKDFNFPIKKQTVIIEPDKTSEINFKVSTKNRNIRKSKKTFKL